MLEAITRSLSFRLLAIFLVLAALFVYGATVALRWIYADDDLRELISGHRSLHVEYVRQDIGNPPRIDRAIAITKQVPVDIRIAGPDGPTDLWRRRLWQDRSGPASVIYIRLQW